MIKIREMISGEEDEISKVVSQGNLRVLDKLGIDRKSWPRHQANCRKEIIVGGRAKGDLILLADLESEIIGTISLKKVGTSIEVKRLSVLPEFQNRGVGSLLLNYAIDYGREERVARVKLGAIEENIELINWYKNFGFIPKKSKRFKGIPVNILFLELPL